MSLEVWDKDQWLATDDKIGTFRDLVIPFHEITTNYEWETKKFNISSEPYAYLDIQFRLESCYANFRELGCNFCSESYYTSTCDKYCTPELGNYTCNSSGNKMCAAHKTGEKCEECAENYFPEKVCDVRCIAVEGRYTCSDLGGKVCHDNWTGVDCSSCAEHRTGEICENCTERWGGNKCQECAKDYYPDGVCNTRCTGVQNKFPCTKDGRKACFQNWKGGNVTYVLKNILVNFVKRSARRQSDITAVHQEKWFVSITQQLLKTTARSSTNSLRTKWQ